MQALRLCLTMLVVVYTILPASPAFALLDPLTVSPTAPRHQKPIDQRPLIVDVPPAERAAMLASITVEDTTESLTVKSRNDFSHEIPDTDFEEIRVPVGTIAHGPNGSTLELKAIGVYYPHNVREACEKNADLSFYTPRGEPIASSQLEALGIVGWQTDVVQPRKATLAFPRCRFYFAQQLGDGGRWVGFSLKDGRTSWHDHSGFGYKPSEDGKIIMFEYAPSFWQPSPIQVRVDCVFPPFEVREMNATPDATVSFPDFDIRYLGTFITGFSSWSSTHDSLGFVKHPAPPGHSPWTGYVFAAVPQIPAANLSIDVLGSDGQHVGVLNPIPMSLGVLSDSPAGARDRPARFVIKRPTKLVRFEFDLPELPGLPPQNRNVSDLLEVIVPYARFYSEFELAEFLRGATQMNINVTNPPPSRSNPTAAPMEYENATVRTLLHEFAKRQGPYQIYSNEAEETITIETPDSPSPQLQTVEKQIKSLF